jgi:hypothetical protein
MHLFRLSLIPASDKIVLSLRPSSRPSSRLQYPSDPDTIIWNKVSLEPLGREEYLLALPVFETGWGPKQLFWRVTSDQTKDNIKFGMRLRFLLI